MTFVAIAVVVVGLLAMRRRAAGRKRMLAGLVDVKPVFQVEPPRRHWSDARGERL